MPRIRTIKPDAFLHEGLYDLEHDTKLPVRWAFAGLWCHADRRGRFEWRPRRLKVGILPHDSADFSRVLDALTTRGFIFRYACEGVEYGWIESFQRHQVINNREAESYLPPHPNDPDQSTTWTRGARVVDACLTEPQPCTVEGKGREGKGKEQEGKGTCTSLALRAVKEPEDFSQFKAGYPKGPNVGTFKHALKVWCGLSDTQRASALAALPDYARSDSVMRDGGRFVPTPQKWLTDEWWLKTFRPPSALMSQNPRTAGNAAAVEQFIAAYGDRRESH